jgi:transcriptional regulator with XRE-family HTH domain
MDADQLVRDARTRAELTQRQLAERARTSQAAIAAYERGTKHPQLNVLERILAAAGFELRVNLTPLPPLQTNQISVRLPGGAIRTAPAPQSETGTDLTQLRRNLQLSHLDRIRKMLSTRQATLELRGLALKSGIRRSVIETMDRRGRQKG